MTFSWGLVGQQAVSGAASSFTVFVMLVHMVCVGEMVKSRVECWQVGQKGSERLITP